MAHPTHNRKGIFNTPVDPVALGLPDYFAIISKPMDFGTVKARLHSLAYRSRDEVVADIRLVLDNAMKYNPPLNAVHVSARELLIFFEDQLQAFVPEMAMPFGAEASLGLSEAPVPLTNVIDSSSDNNFLTRTVSTETYMLNSASLNNETFDSQQTTIMQTSIPLNKFKASDESVYNLGTRLSVTPEELAMSDVQTAPKRKKRGSRVDNAHDCYVCEGRTCSICLQGCLHLEPTLLICNGFNCAGAKIRKGATYYIAPDGSRQYCQKCFIGLPPVLPVSGTEDVCRYKVNLLKRKNDEEIVERWLTCVRCQNGVHAVCAIHNEFSEVNDEFICPECMQSENIRIAASTPHNEDVYTFVSGSDLPIHISNVTSTTTGHLFGADNLPQTNESVFIQQKVQERMKTSDYPNAEKTITIRIISDCSRSFSVPEVVRKHFQMPTRDKQHTVVPPSKVNYRSKAIALFQKIDGLDVCIFCMYVQEYDGDDIYDIPTDGELIDRKKRVYIAYLDSVEHFQPRTCRTKVYHELLVSYLASARKRGYESAHIWACPPSRGNSFVFWNHPSSQRTPTLDRLVAWYHGALSRAVDCGVVTDVKSLYESEFQERLGPLSHSDATLEGKMECPPLFDGDFWIEEAVRVHEVNFSRYLKAKPEPNIAPATTAEDQRICPAVEVSVLLRDRVIAHPSSLPFRRPVNAAALKLKDYHKIISKPMDLGTVYSRLVLGEYSALKDVVADIELVFANAKRYNPVGHVVHEKAIEVSHLFYTELNTLSWTWAKNSEIGVSDVSWTSFADISMNLDVTIFPNSITAVNNDPSCLAHPENLAASRDIVHIESNLLKAAELSPPDLVFGGADAVQKRMVGDDVWLLDKRNPGPPKGALPAKKHPGRRRKSDGIRDSSDEPALKRRRQSWLAEEVGSSVRRNRMSFFSCSLKPLAARSVVEDEKIHVFRQYASSFDMQNEVKIPPSIIADARHALLEFSQCRNLEFDTLRHAKYSSAILLYHLHNDGAAGTFPWCSLCSQKISSVRWHRISRVTDRRRPLKRPSVAGRQAKQSEPFKPEELGSDCYSNHAEQDEFIPVQVSFST